jgi:nitrous oxide reductase
MKNSITVIPAYGRDYKSKAQIQKDWDEGKDFLINDIISPHDGRYINKQDASNSGLCEIRVRYSNLRKVTVIKG